MTTPSLPTPLRNSLTSPTAAKAGERRRTARPAERQPVANPHRLRLSRVTIGLWLGAVLLGAGGCLFGAGMPYHHPVAVTASALWWGIYFGCLGASLGALIGLLTDRSPTTRQRIDTTSTLAREEDLP